MRRRRGRGAIAPSAYVATLAELDTPDFARVLLVAAAAQAALMSLIALRTMPRTMGVTGFVALSVVVVGAAIRGWRDREGWAPTVPLALLSVLCVWFAVGLPASPDEAPMRLLQVALVSLGLGTALAGPLHRRWGVRPAMAIGAAVGVAAQLVVIEVVAAGPYRSAASAVTSRPEWNGLRAGAVQSPATVQDSTSLAWSAPAAPDSAVGIAFRPNTTLHTLYPDNPRGYFRAGDFRPDIWTLVTAEGSSARLELPREPERLRVAITNAQRNVPAWHIMLDQARLQLTAGRTYELTFRARADRRRPIVVAVTQAQAPFDPLGLVTTVELTPEWAPFRMFVTPPRNAANARLHFALGGHDASVELDSVALHDANFQRVAPDVSRHPWIVSYRFNDLGCRGAQVDDARAEAARILLLGGGFVTGVGVHEEDSFGARLEAASRANRGTPSVHVLNCGVPGYGTAEHVEVYQRVARFRPALVLLFLDPEADRTHWEAAQRAVRDRAPSRAEQLSRTWATISQLHRTRRNHDYGPSVADLVRLRDEVAGNGGRLAIVLARTDGSAGWTDLHDALTTGLNGTVPIIDTDDALRATLGWDSIAVHPTDPHPDEKVHAAMARLLAQRIPDLMRPGAPAANVD